MTTQELREKRAKAWEAAKAFLNTKRQSDGTISAEDEATYDKMESEVVALGKEIEREERAAALDRELSAATSSPLLSRPNTSDAKTGRASDAYRKAFFAALRRRKDDSLAPELQNALQLGTLSEGGYLAPDEFERRLIEKIADTNVMRKLCTCITTANDRNIPIVESRGAAAWTAEEGAVHESDDSFAQITIGAHKATRVTKVADELLSDNAFDLESYLVNSFGLSFGELEEAAVVSGNGTGKPTGITTDVTGAETALTTASAAAITVDELIDLYYGVKEGYRNKGVWLLNDATVKYIRKLKDGNGQYLWQPGLNTGTSDMLLGKPLYTSVSVPTIAAGAKPVLFGDFSYYWIADRMARTFKPLYELYAGNGQVGFLGTQRVDGKLTLTEAVKCIKMHA